MVVKNPAEIGQGDETERKVRPIAFMTLDVESEMVLL